MGKGARGMPIGVKHHVLLAGKSRGSLEDAGKTHQKKDAAEVEAFRREAADRLRALI